MGRLKNFYINLRVFIYSIFHGMEAGNALLEQRENSTDNDSDIVARKEQDSVFKDFIKGEETQRVKETRDEMYRVLEASENLVVENQKLDFLSEMVAKSFFHHGNGFFGVLENVTGKVFSALVIVNVKMVVFVIGPVEIAPLHAVFAELHVHAVIKLGTGQ